MARAFEFLSPMGKAVEFDAMSCTESLGRMFDYQVTVVSERGDLKPAHFLYKSMTVRMSMPDRPERFFNGYCVQFRRGAVRGEWFTYHLGLAPWTWFMTRTSDCKIFQNKTVPQIIKDVFGDEARLSLVDRLTGSYRPWTYCVQYRETDFDFVSRLMEQEGIYYFFEHGNGQHRMILCDNKSSHKTTVNPKIPFQPVGSAPKSQQEFARLWTEEREIQPDRFSLDDFDYETPGNDMRTSRQAENNTAGSGGGDYEMFMFPGEHDDISEGDHYAGYRIEAMHSNAETYVVQGLHYNLASGQRFTLADHPQDDFNREYLVTGLHVEATESQERSSEQKGTTFEVSFRCISSRQQFRPPRSTARPLIHGVQSAEVVGTGDDVHTDKLGRVKVQFRWDRYGKKDDKSSCWIRVASPWANSNFGMVSLPRVGSEVIVAFMDGDPDRPVIVGSVYNGDNVPPFPLPGKKGVSGLKSKTLGGGAADFNELSFDDSAGDEKVFLQAKKDYEVQVQNNFVQVTKQDAHFTVERDAYLQVNRKLHLKVNSDLMTKMDGAISLSGEDFNAGATKRLNGEAGQEIHLKSGMTVTIDAGVSLTLKVGGSYINLNSAGVFIEGPMVMINSGGAAGSGSGVQLKSPAKAAVNKAGADIKGKPPRPARPMMAGPWASGMKNSAKAGSATY